ncbi:MAG TPA: hypothetical protein VJM84_05650 [Actinomycetota bacterium]|nr:hypothetical protein [Actinomycetota bacterium]
MRKALIALSMTVAVVAGVATANAQRNAPTQAGGVDPANFTTPVSNPYYPLVVGRIATFRGGENGARLLERVTTTHRTKIIQGVTTTVVLDVVWRNGRIHEKTHDWYANDNVGNVWYFGERTAVYDAQGGIVSTAGSWKSGVDGAVAGLIMPADPEPTDAYRQELYVGEAEDQAWTVTRGGSVTVPYGTVDHVVRSFEWTRLEPQVMGMKLYAPGLGIVWEGSFAGGNEQLRLVTVSG